MAGDGDRLVGWKAIGSFLGVDARTARRWEEARGLPVRRLPGDGSATVWASRAELRTWLSPANTAKTSPPTAVMNPGNQAIARPAAVQLGLLRPSGWRAFAGRRRRWQIAAATAAVVGGSALAAARLLPTTVSSTFAATGYDDDTAARQQWLAGRFALATRSAGGIAAATHDFETLTVRYPDRAAAFAALAEAHVLSREFGAVTDAEAFSAAGRAARAALALDPGSADATAAKAFVDFWWRHDVAGGLTGFRHAVALAPDTAKFHHWYATAAGATGNDATARAEIARARALDPGNHAIVADAALIELCAGNVAGARAALAQFVALDPALAAGHRYLAIADLVAGDDAGFLAEQATTLRLLGRDDALVGIAAARVALAAGGRQAMMVQLTRDAVAAYAVGTGTAAAVARLRAVAGDRAGTIAWLAASRAAHEAESSFLTSEPQLRAWRDDPAIHAFAVDR